MGRSVGQIPSYNGMNRFLFIIIHFSYLKSKIPNSAHIDNKNSDKLFLEIFHKIQILKVRVHENMKQKSFIKMYIKYNYLFKYESGV